MLFSIRLGHEGGWKFRTMIGAGLLTAAFFIGLSEAKADVGPTPTPGEQAFTVLCYHRFVAHPESMKSPLNEYQMPISEFRWQMQYLKDNGITPISMQQLRDYWFQGKPLPLKPVLITFDDGFRTVFTDAFPIIKEFNYPAVFFLYTKFIEGEEEALLRSQKSGKPTRATKGTEAVHEDDLRMMEKEGFDFESHTANHLHMGWDEDKKTPAEYAHELEYEMSEPLTYIQSKFKYQAKSIAYPYGDYNPLILDETKKLGYDFAFTVNPGPNDRTVPPFKLKRNLVLNPISHKNFAAIFGTKVLHLGNMGPGDGEVVWNEKPLISVEIKDQVDPKSIYFSLGNHPMKFSYNPKLGLVTYRMKEALKAGGHILTLSANDLTGQKRMYTWFFRVKHRYGAEATPESPKKEAPGDQIPP